MNNLDKNNIIDKILEKEWKYFNNLNNIGGRASCQDNKQDFIIMRKSWWLTFNKEILLSYIEDIQNENLLLQKYAYMMEYNDPSEYEKIKNKLPKISDEKFILVNNIMYIYMKWEEEFFKLYPTFASMGRPLYSDSDDIFDTSIETYLRGELLSYSINTLKLILNYIENLNQEKYNLVIENMDNLAKLQGFIDSQDVENYYSKK